ncbi:ATP-binding protein [Williamsia serinedens]|uniref:Phage shock protein C (PspC) family protein n=1 Tax=Williamsia serinedens TaxID=391736 RepID=A0ABT1GZL3_9NOCA|nr:ATP-binding protein [Williamsia serinedens]MCP2160391.1 phage shock protein C (PspC) family protein [Williamsia serinedens]
MTTRYTRADAPSPRDEGSTPRIARRDGGRVVGGVAGGVADHLGVRPVVVRLVFVALTVLAGAGVMAYALLWFFCPPGDDTDPPAPGERSQAIGLAVLGAVGLLVVGSTASGTPAGYLIPIAVIAIGAAVVWREVDLGDRRRTSVLTWLRLVGGAALVVVGLVVVVVAGNRSFGGLNSTLLAVAATLVGVVVLTIPLWMRLVRTADAERSARIRTAEREEIAVHLHDSVLQTLALIQKRSDSPDEVARLARSQERELRRWLFDGPRGEETSVSAALATVAAEVEDGYGIEVDLVTVGETDHRCDALVGAAREALVNAAKHSGQKRVDVYAELSDTDAQVFVRDRGRGFDPDTVAADRQGIARSIRARIERHGGTVDIRSSAERGTEVTLRVHFDSPASGSDAAEGATQ